MIPERWGGSGELTAPGEFPGHSSRRGNSDRVQRNLIKEKELRFGRPRYWAESVRQGTVKGHTENSRTSSHLHGVLTATSEEIYPRRYAGKDWKEPSPNPTHDQELCLYLLAKMVNLLIHGTARTLPLLRRNLGENLTLHQTLLWLYSTKLKSHNPEGPKCFLQTQSHLRAML